MPPLRSPKRRFFNFFIDTLRGASCKPRPLSSDIVELLLLSAYPIGNEFLPFIVELRHPKVEHWSCTPDVETRYKYAELAQPLRVVESGLEVSFSGNFHNLLVQLGLGKKQFQSLILDFQFRHECTVPSTL